MTNCSSATVGISSRLGNSDTVPVRLLHTDSGHYMLPADDLDGQAAEERTLRIQVAQAIQVMVNNLIRPIGEDHAKQDQTKNSVVLANGVTTCPDGTDDTTS